MREVAFPELVRHISEDVTSDRNFGRLILSHLSNCHNRMVQISVMHPHSQACNEYQNAKLI
jgi:hypothetical protein